MPTGELPANGPAMLVLIKNNQLLYPGQPEFFMKWEKYTPRE
jgi:hypothetical protein